MAEALIYCIRACDLSSVLQTAEACLESCVTTYTDCRSVDFRNVQELHESWLGVALAFALIPAGGLFAGLTIGLLSLDGITLQILEHAGEPKEREHARKIIPIRKQGNLLLCTLLLGNTVINAAISILLADIIDSGIWGLVLSTFLILIFGEIIPQSICTRHGLAIGANSIWIVQVCIALLSPVTWPISQVLDWMLGRDIGNVYSREELKHLIDIHVMDPDVQAESGLTFADQRLIVGALDYKNKRVKDVMTSLDQCFMLEMSLRLTFQTMMAIYKSGFTRIPVFSGDRQNVVGVLYAKDLILVDPDDCIEVATVLSFRGRNFSYVSEEMALDEVLKSFVQGNNHIMIAHKADSTGHTDANIEAAFITGLITLEDVMETLIQQEIVDETDNFEDMNTGSRRNVARADVANFLAMFEHKLHHSQVLSPGELQAVCAFLPLNVAEFSPLGAFENPLKGLISHAEVLELELNAQADANGDSNGSPPSSRGQSLSLTSRFSYLSADVPTTDQVTLYERGTPTDVFTLILQGKVLIRTGEESFEFERGPWNCLASKALTSPTYLPDFDAVGIAPLRVLRFRRPAFLAALEATSLQPVIVYQRSRSMLLQTDSSRPVSERTSPCRVPSPGPQTVAQADFNAAEYLQRKSRYGVPSSKPERTQANELQASVPPNASGSEIEMENLPLLSREQT